METPPDETETDGNEPQAMVSGELGQPVCWSEIQAPVHLGERWSGDLV